MDRAPCLSCQRGRLAAGRAAGWLSGAIAGEALHKAMSSEHHTAEVDWTLVGACVLSMCQLLVMGKATVTMKKKGQPVSQDLTQVYESTILSLVQLVLGTVPCCAACVPLALPLFV